MGRKALPRAVDRNRFKRKVREALRAAQAGIERYDLIVRLKRPAPGPELASAAEEAASMLATLSLSAATASPAQ